MPRRPSSTSLARRTDPGTFERALTLVDRRGRIDQVSHEVNDLLGRMRVDPATHQTLRPYFFLRCKPKKAMKEELDFADVIATGDTPLPKEYAACKDIGGF